MIKLLNGDCLELMKDIPDKSVDMILCDLPYGTTANKWDKIIDSEKLWKEYERIITNKGAIALFSSGQFTNKLINSNENLYRYKWLWLKNKKRNFVNAKNRPMTQYEEICIFSKGITANTKHTERKMNYFPQGLTEINLKIKNRDSKFGTVVGKRPSHKKETVRTHTGYPSELLYYDCVNKPLHPTQKPVDLLEYLIKTYTKEGMTVLDNCMGSGSTGVACKKLNRNFIGMELDEGYFKVAEERIANVRNENILQK